MAKILVVYATKTGCTAECAQKLERALCGQEVTLFDLANGQPDLSPFDLIVLGSSVRYRKLLPSASRFLKENAQTLLQKPFGFYLCCGFPADFEESLSRFLPQSLLSHCYAATCFGGKLDLGKGTFWDRLLIRYLRSSIVNADFEDGEYTPVLPGLIPESISNFVTSTRLAIQSNIG